MEIRSQQNENKIHFVFIIKSKNKKQKIVVILDKSVYLNNPQHWNYVIKRAISKENNVDIDDIRLFNLTNMETAVKKTY